MAFNLCTWILSWQFWLVIGLTYFVYRHLTKKKYNLPPLPCSYPLIGNVYHVLFGKEILYKWCHRMSKEVGPVMRITLGPVEAVVLNDYDSVHEALMERGNDFSGRMKSKMMEIFSDGYIDVALGDPSQATFKVRRKLLATSLKNFTIGREYEGRVKHSLGRLFSHLDQLAEKKEAFDPTEYCQLLSYNVISSICFQSDYAFDDKEFRALIQMFKDANEAFGTVVTITDFLPGAQYLPFEFWDVKMARRIRDRFVGILEREMVTSKKRAEDQAEIKDLTAFVLKTQEEGAKEGLDQVTQLEIVQLIGDVFGAGVDTTQMTLRWILLCLAIHQDIQEKVHQEIIDHVNEDESLVSGIDYKAKMPYSEAVLLETTRFGLVATMGLPHATMCDTRVKGYDIPAGTNVFLNQWAINHDERDFEKPEEFIPERFLDEEGKVGPRPRGYLPFGLGRRSCPGETTAKNTLWMTFVSIVKRYRIRAPDGVELKAEYKNKNAFEGLPVDYSIVLEKR